MRIDFVSDVACPWCAIGMSALERALERIRADVGEVEVHLQPFELNPTMGPEGADAAQYLSEKFGLSPEQLAVNRARIAERGAAEGFAFGTRSHVWNTDDAPRLLFLAAAEGPPGARRAVERALLTAYHGADLLDGGDDGGGIRQQDHCNVHRAHQPRRESPDERGQLIRIYQSPLRGRRSVGIRRAVLSDEV